MVTSRNKNGSSRQVDHDVNILYETHMDLQADVLVRLGPLDARRSSREKRFVDLFMYQIIIG